MSDDTKVYTGRAPDYRFKAKVRGYHYDFGVAWKGEDGSINIKPNGIPMGDNWKLTPTGQSAPVKNEKKIEAKNEEQQPYQEYNPSL